MARTSERSLLAPVVGGLALIAALVLAIYFRADLWRGIKWVGEAFSTWITDWVPNHPGQTVAIVAFVVLAFVLNWIAHIRGRLRAWIFAIVVELGLWFLFWFGAVILPPLNELLGLNLEAMPTTTVIISGLVVVGVTGAIFWFLEAREEWRKYRRRHHVDED
jgi:hypothetical protein